MSYNGEEAKLDLPSGGVLYDDMRYHAEEDMLKELSGLQNKSLRSLIWNILEL